MCQPMYKLMYILVEKTTYTPYSSNLIDRIALFELLFFDKSCTEVCEPLESSTCKNTNPT